MLDFLFTLGQVAAAMLVLYGAVLVIGTLHSKSRNVTPAQEDAFLLLKHLQNDA
jgi:hypothetical protein